MKKEKEKKTRQMPRPKPSSYDELKIKRIKELLYPQYDLPKAA
jgi:hypothetical protein